MSEIRVALLGGAVVAAWQHSLTDAQVVKLRDVQRDGEIVDVLLVDGNEDSSVAELRALRSRVPYAQPVVVLEDGRRAAVQRAITLSAGLGEVWLIAPNELDQQLITRAAEIAKQRRNYATQVRRQETAPISTQSPPVRRRVITDTFLATVLQVARVAVFSIDARHHVLSMNPAAERLFDIRVEEGVGRFLFDVIHPVNDAEATELLTRRGYFPHVEFGFGGDTRRVFEIDIAEVVQQPDALRVMVAHDITDSVRQNELLEEQAAELEHQADQLAHQAAELEHLMEARSRFYAAMNHEIRTPINAILGFNDLLLGGIYGDLAAEQREGIERSQKAARHLLEIVNDVLDLSKIEAGRVEIQIGKHRLDDLIRDLLETMEPTLIESGSPIECELACEPVVYTDDRRVRQILMNLLSNAAKFGNENPITVRCARAGDDIRIDVIDRGVGIPPDQLSSIFDEFVQLRERRHSGTGLGLAISQRLAGLLGGRLEVQSELGQGSTFSLVLPGAARPPA